MDMETTRQGGVRTESLAMQAYRHFRRQLMAGRYKPGQKIKLREVSEELGISATPIREALGRLVSEHALFQVDRRSVRVPVMDAARYRDISEVRILLEGEAAFRAAIVATARDVEYMKSVHDALCDAHESGAMGEVMAGNERFHHALCGLAGMPVLLHLVENLWLQCGPTMNAFLDYPPRAPRTKHAHLLIIDGLRRNDPEAARAALALDIRASVRRIVAYLDDHAPDRAP